MQVGFVLVLLVLWYLATNRWGVNRLLLPNPVAVWHELIDVLASRRIICPICGSP